MGKTNRANNATIVSSEKLLGFNRFLPSRAKDRAPLTNEGGKTMSQFSAAQLTLLSSSN